MLCSSSWKKQLEALCTMKGEQDGHVRSLDQCKLPLEGKVWQMSSSSVCTLRQSLVHTEDYSDVQVWSQTYDVISIQVEQCYGWE